MSSSRPWLVASLLPGVFAVVAFGCGSSSPEHGSPGTDAGGGDHASATDSSVPAESATRDAFPRSDGGREGSSDAREETIGVVDAGVCPGAPEAGAWQNVTPPAAASVGTGAIAVRPDYPSTLYAGAQGLGIFRSKDCGATWAVVSTGTHASDMSSGNPWSMAIDPVTPDTMYVVEGYGSSGLWKSTNGGVDWENTLTDPTVTAAFYANGFITGVSIDPTDHTHLVIESHGNCASGFTCGAESTDSGGTWKLVDMTSVGVWSENSSIAIIDQKNWLYCGLFSGFFRTADEGASWQAVDAGGALPSCNYYDPFVWQAKDGRYYVPSIVYGGPALLQSQPDDLTTWALIPSSPQATVLTPTENNLILSRGGTAGTGGDFNIASKSDPTTWKNFSIPSSWGMNDSGVFVAYDGSHHILYSSNWGLGLWQTTVD